MAVPPPPGALVSHFWGGSHCWQVGKSRESSDTLVPTSTRASRGSCYLKINSVRIIDVRVSIVFFCFILNCWIIYYGKCLHISLKICSLTYSFTYVFSLFLHKGIMVTISLACFKGSHSRLYHAGSLFQTLYNPNAWNRLTRMCRPVQRASVSC